MSASELGAKEIEAERQTRHPYRVFISYSHEDRLLAEKVCAIVGDLGFEPIWDERFKIGWGFHAQIKMFIAHAHVFLPLITESSSKRGWVHQEIGYAVALNIPVLPVAWGSLPDEMLRELHAVVLSGDQDAHDADLRRKLTRSSVDTLLSGFKDEGYALYEAAPFAEDRALLMSRYANEARELNRAEILRQKGGLSSLHIPNKVITDPVWQIRYGAMPKGAYHCRLQRDERLALEYHARQAGFKVIIAPDLPFGQYGPEARKARLSTLIAFLASTAEDARYQVALQPAERAAESVTILGDWFYAESVSPKRGIGYRQTIYTCHAPSMQAKIDLFDQEFAGLLDGLGWQPEHSKTLALAALKEVVASI